MLSSSIIHPLTFTTLVAVIIGCASTPTARADGGSDEQVSSKVSSKIAPTKQDAKPAKVTMEMVTVKDPVEYAFSMQMPKGWKNMAYLSRIYDNFRVVDTAVSPDGGTVLFSGDPKMPNYTPPQFASNVHEMWAKISPMYAIAPYEEAESYFKKYVDRKFSKLPGFKIVSVDDDPDGAQKTVEALRKYGMQSEVTAAKIRFDYTDKGRKMHTVVNGVTVNNGQTWTPEVNGISSNGNPDDYIPMMEAMGASKKVNPAWQQQQQTKAQQGMQQIQQFGDMLTQQHNENMAWIQRSAALHQQRMDAIHAQGDASMKAYYDRDASSDVQQRNFLNYINDESTVVNSSGKSFQVDNSYQTYFINKSTQKYIGGDSHMTVDDLRKFGLNPDDYEATKIKTNSGS
ncbi:hypothetical protein BH11ARM1_BH11ARM1_15670 [soil metagenome]